MRHRIKKKTLKRKSDQRKLLLRTMVNQFLKNGSIKTTLVKGRVIKSKAEHLIKVGMTNDLNHRRRLIKVTNNPKLANTIINEISPKYKDQKGGYCRLVKTGKRKGDAAMTVKISLIDK
ncbi:50S ribosomal protein L17 [Patescibacteria group bacterium]